MAREGDGPASSSVGDETLPPAPEPWLYALALMACLTKLGAVLVAPGLPGIASSTVIDRAQLASAVASYFLLASLVAVSVAATLRLSRVARVSMAARGAVAVGSGVVVATIAPAVAHRLQPGAILVLLAATTLVVVVASVASMRAPHTRAVALVLSLLAATSLAKTVAFALALWSGSHASLRAWQIARGASTVAVALEIIAVLVAAAWLGTRSRVRGRFAANVALIGAFIVSWYGLTAASPAASPVALVLKSTLGAAAAQPPPFALEPVAIFLLPASIFVALSALAQRDRLVPAFLALGLLSRGAFDVPLQALMATVASMWLLVTSADRSALWRGLVRTREQRLAEDEGDDEAKNRLVARARSKDETASGGSEEESPRDDS